MRTAQLMCATFVVASLSVAACNRPDTRDNARVAVAEVKDVAGRASEKLADSWLATKIQAQYFADKDVKARNIVVSARDGVVTLKGRVETPGAREQALQIAKNTDGVLHVEDQLTLGSGPAASPAALTAPQPPTAPVATSGVTPSPEPPIAERLNDSGITASIQSKYFLDGNLKGRRIEVDARLGVVTLRGEVESDNERAQALILARTTEGVQRVEDALTVTIVPQQAPAVQATQTAPNATQTAPGSIAVPAAPGAASALPAAPPSAPATAPAAAQGQDAALSSQLESKFAADRQMKAAAIEVSARDGVVLLEGTVPTAAARQRALALARETKGVTQIVDRLSIKR